MQIHAGPDANGPHDFASQTFAKGAPTTIIWIFPVDRRAAPASACTPACPSRPHGYMILTLFASAFQSKCVCTRSSVSPIHPSTLLKHAMALPDMMTAPNHALRPSHFLLRTSLDASNHGPSAASLRNFSSPQCSLRIFAFSFSLHRLSRVAFLFFLLLLGRPFHGLRRRVSTSRPRLRNSGRDPSKTTRGAIVGPPLPSGLASAV
ncbi:hypothetical protein DM02DRAFT_79116 [Periconia macrospinosa]|uniref:Uncharacterized protein n=1 Tax=Periconia macrospinosa TaxID=97972 RepID=A0A2V1DHZ7_9PLEO|nr:hypothetical protein DM02DRAFT_79116 [Periconia macrospinosa]